MFDTHQLRKGQRVMVDDYPFIVVDAEHVKPGKGQAFSRVKMKNLLNNSVLVRTFKSGDKLPPADIIDRTMNFLYATEDTYHFMDNSNFEQCELNKSALDDNWKWLVDGMEVQVTIYNNNPVGINLPNFSTLAIVECPPAVKGDTVVNATKTAVLQTGAEVKVPMFVENGEKIRIDTRTGLYIDRAK